MTYHDFSKLGIRGTGVFPLGNQRAKERVIGSYLKLVDGDSVLELFGADGYYSALAIKNGAREATVVDNDHSGKWLEDGMEMAERLNLAIRFVNQDVHEYDTPADIVINAGGLYHVHDPLEVLQHSYDLANKWLIVQSVVSVRKNESFRIRGHGSRFPLEFLNDYIYGHNWDVVTTNFNTLPLNKNPEDKGSIYYLIRK